jgi:hypothetical protein
MQKSKIELYDSSELKIYTTLQFSGDETQATKYVTIKLDRWLVGGRICRKRVEN